MGASCYFIGHRDAGENLLSDLTVAVERHVMEFGVIDFFVGHYGGFDSLAARVLKESKELHPEIRLTLVLPYHPAIQPISIPKGFGGTLYPWEGEKIPKRLAIIKTNQHMVDVCDYLIAYAHHSFGGTGQIMEYARKREKKGLIRITNLSQKPSAL